MNLLARKYHPVFFSDFISNLQIIDIIQHQLSHSVPLVVLFVGNAAAGKTTCIETIIHEYYKGIPSLVYDENILVMNNLKEQGVQYCRTDVRNFCQTSSCISQKKKIVVMDDLDTMNEQNQQVFRNYIDKYSHRVLFLASCTSTQKVIESLRSRFQIFPLHHLTREAFFDLTKRVVQEEHIQMNNDAMSFICSVTYPMVRGLLNCVEKCKILSDATQKTIDLATVKRLCTTIHHGTLEVYTREVLSGNLASSIQVLNEIHDQEGVSVMDILYGYFSFIKTTNMLSEQQKYALVPYICKYITIFYTITEDEIELALFTNNIIQALTSCN